MTTDLAVKLLEIAAEKGIEATDYPDYSGRCMYGKTTAGVVVPSRDDFTDLIVETVLDADGRGFAEEIKKLRSDNLGRDLIVY